MATGKSGIMTARRHGQLQQDGLAGPFELADQSILDAVSEVAIGLQALQRAQNSLATLAGQQDQLSATPR